MTEYEILSFIHKNRNMATSSELSMQSVFANDPDLLTDDLRLEYLATEGYISGKPEHGVIVMLTQKGIARLDELEQQQKEKKEQRRHEWLLAIFSALFGALLSEPLWVVIKALFRG